MIDPHNNPEIKRVTTLRDRFSFLNKQWIAVSFVHMATVMLLFSDGGIITTIAVLVMVLGIDLALMWLSAYVETQRRYKQPVGFFPWLAFVVALAVELGFNTGALWSHAPASLGVLGKALAVTFGTFVALIIYVSATIQSRLDRTAGYIYHVAETNRRNAQLEREAKQREEDERRERQRLAELQRQQAAAAAAIEAAEVERVDAIYAKISQPDYPAPQPMAAAIAPAAAEFDPYTGEAIVDAEVLDDEDEPAAPAEDAEVLEAPADMPADTASTDEFASWVRDMVDNRGYKRAEIARLTGKSRAWIGQVYKGTHRKF